MYVPSTTNTPYKIEGTEIRDSQGYMIAGDYTKLIQHIPAFLMYFDLILNCDETLNEAQDYARAARNLDNQPPAQRPTLNRED